MNNCKQLITLFLVILLSISSAGCGPLRNTEYDAATAISNVELGGSDPNESIIEVLETEYSQAEPVRTAKPSKTGSISLNFDKHNYWDAISTIAKAKNYFIERQPEVDINLGVSIRLENVSPVEAIKKIAESVGYVAVYHPSEHKISIGTKGVRIYRLPESSFIGQDVSASVVENDFGGLLSDTPLNSADISDTLVALGIPHEQISIIPATGLIAINGSAAELKIASEYLMELNYFLTANIDLHVAMISVRKEDRESFSSFLSYINGNALNFTSGSSTGGGGGANFRGEVIKNNFQGILSALGEYQLGKIVNELNLSTLNRRHVSFFSGFSIPHLSEITEQQNPTNNTTTITGTTDITEDGVWVWLRPEIISYNQVLVHILPRLNAVERIETFNLGQNLLSVPVENRSEGSFSTRVQNGEVAIIGGIKIRTDREDASGLPNRGISRLLGSSQYEQIEYELWIVLQAIIDDTHIINPLVSEKLI